MNSDNWQHRSETMRCRTCMWYVQKGHGNLGRCRRRAPTMNGYPAVFQSDWCGDHKLAEDRVADGGEPHSTKLMDEYLEDKKEIGWPAGPGDDQARQIETLKGILAIKEQELFNLNNLKRRWLEHEELSQEELAALDSADPTHTDPPKDTQGDEMGNP